MNQNTEEQKYIEVRGAAENILKNISVSIPHNKLTVVTGVSGSGKSTLVFDTLFSEGQRKYIESSSSYIRQFLGKLPKPDVEKIEGLPPAIAVEQKAGVANPRSTVGTISEIYDYLKILYARIGKVYSPVTNKVIRKHTVDSIIQEITAHSYPFKGVIYFRKKYSSKEILLKDLEHYRKQGFSRVKIKDAFYPIDSPKIKNSKDGIYIVVDRFQIQDGNEDEIMRLSESILLAISEGVGKCFFEKFNEDESTKMYSYSTFFEEDDTLYEEPSMNLFTFSNSYGACPRCEGFGTMIGIDEDKVIPDRGLSVFGGVVGCWRSEKMSSFLDDFLMAASKTSFPIHRPYSELKKAEKAFLWNGNEEYPSLGIHSFFQELERRSYKMHYRILLSRYRGRSFCNECNGSRLRKEALYVKINNTSIDEIVNMPLFELHDFLETLTFTEEEKEITTVPLYEIQTRIKSLIEIGLGYLSLNRSSSTLSGGEAQRVTLSRLIGSSLTGSLYILDEPSIGLHMRDTKKLIATLKQLCALDNTVIVVEHDEDIMRSADYLIDLGPKAGNNGGEVTFQGTVKDFFSSKKGKTFEYLSGDKKAHISFLAPKKIEFTKFEGIYKHNITNQNVGIPHNCLCTIVGVSGSGKTTLIQEVIVPTLQSLLSNLRGKKKNCKAVTSNYKKWSRLEVIGQSPLGKSSRSNPMTISGAYDYIRNLYSTISYTQGKMFSPNMFSFNVEKGRCFECNGEGKIKIDMQFMPDIAYECEVCKGKRFTPEVLEVEFKGKSIADIFEMTIEEAHTFFSETENKNRYTKNISKSLKSLLKVGLGYLLMGQSSSSFSGGEAQRMKLAEFTTHSNSLEPILFIFDEPTTGLHFEDVRVLMTCFQELVEMGHTVLTIEHHPDVIKSSNYIIEIGPESGNKGGKIVFQGNVDDFFSKKTTITSKLLS